MTTNQTRGGFIGDLAEAFAPPAAGGCCGAPAATSGPQADGAAEQAEAAATACCGSTAAAPAAEAGSTGCCG